MPRKIPIEIERISKEYFGNLLTDNGIENKKESYNEYLISIEEKNTWTKTYKCDLQQLTELYDKITQLINEASTAEKLEISNEKGEFIDEHYSKDIICKDCVHKLTKNCLTCLFELQSPLERKLFIALKSENFWFNTQYPLDWYGKKTSIYGKSYDDPNNNFKDVLTIVDFYIEKKDIKLCVYTDGHTYHERTEEQAQRDKRIDRKLQELGFKVLRYTGKEVNENTGKIINEINKWLN